MNSFFGDKLSSRQILIFLFSICFLGGFLGNVIIYGLLSYNHLDMNSLIQDLNENSDISHRKYISNILAINHLSTFLLPVLVLLSLLYYNKWTSIVRLTTPKNIGLLILGVFWLLLSYPFIEWLYTVNKAIPLPQWMNTMEDSTNEIVINLLGTPDIGLLFLNLLVMAILPALGEELVFRGVVQPNLIKMVSNYHIAIWITAFVFSAIHMQFQGFLPRMVLGALLGYLSFWSKNLWFPIIAHFFNNAIQVVAFFIVKKNNIEIDLNNNFEFPIYILIISLILFLGIGWYFYRYFLQNTEVEIE